MPSLDPPAARSGATDRQRTRDRLGRMKESLVQVQHFREGDPGSDASWDDGLPRSALAATSRTTPKAGDASASMEAAVVFAKAAVSAKVAAGDAVTTKQTFNHSGGSKSQHTVAPSTTASRPPQPSMDSSPERAADTVTTNDAGSGLVTRTRDSAAPASAVGDVRLEATDSASTDVSADGKRSGISAARNGSAAAEPAKQLDASTKESITEATAQQQPSRVLATSGTKYFDQNRLDSTSQSVAAAPPHPGKAAETGSQLAAKTATPWRKNTSALPPQTVIAFVGAGHGDVGLQTSKPTHASGPSSQASSAKIGAQTSPVRMGVRTAQSDAETASKRDADDGGPPSKENHSVTCNCKNGSPGTYIAGACYGVNGRCDSQDDESSTKESKLAVIADSVDRSVVAAKLPPSRESRNGDETNDPSREALREVNQESRMLLEPAARLRTREGPLAFPDLPGAFGSMEGTLVTAATPETVFVDAHLEFNKKHPSLDQHDGVSLVSRNKTLPVELDKNEGQGDQRDGAHNATTSRDEQYRRETFGRILTRVDQDESQDSNARNIAIEASMPLHLSEGLAHEARTDPIQRTAVFQEETRLDIVEREGIVKEQSVGRGYLPVSVPQGLGPHLGELLLVKNGQQMEHTSTAQVMEEERNRTQKAGQVETKQTLQKSHHAHDGAVREHRKTRTQRARKLVDGLTERDIEAFTPLGDSHEIPVGHGSQEASEAPSKESGESAIRIGRSSRSQELGDAAPGSGYSQPSPIAAINPDINLQETVLPPMDSNNPSASSSPTASFVLAVAGANSSSSSGQDPDRVNVSAVFGAMNAGPGAQVSTSMRAHGAIADVSIAGASDSAPMNSATAVPASPAEVSAVS
eukprot:TRINITY_DN20689_c0_g1_i1.p1 TRINITY_DN20689_c0_g1~~TRINITY_DN20689_c0_g1_i1.p1  ORF type:complete len:952 (+),score=151.17 TRINITY_DN20689_c0_g1_i1:257-2857(+)